MAVSAPAGEAIGEAIVRPQTSVLLTACAGAVLSAAGAPAQTVGGDDWQPVVSQDGVTITYNAATVHETDGAVMATTRGVWATPQPLPEGDGTYTTMVELMSFDCAAGTYIGQTHAYYDADGTEVLTLTQPDAPKPYAGLRAGVVAEKICP